jgi:hypothetical protein
VIASLQFKPQTPIKNTGGSGPHVVAGNSTDASASARLPLFPLDAFDDVEFETIDFPALFGTGRRFELIAAFRFIFVTLPRSVAAKSLWQGADGLEWKECVVTSHRYG